MSHTQEELEQQIETLQRRLQHEQDATIRQALENHLQSLRQQRDQLAPPSPPPSPPPSTTQSMRAGGNITNSPVEYTQTKNVYQTPPDHTNISPTDALATYLNAMVQHCNALSLGPLDQTDAAHHQPMELSQVYVSLSTTTMVEKLGAEEQGKSSQHDRDEQEKQPLSAIEALAAVAKYRLMLLGAPGSGKSTFVNHLASWLARASLARHQHQNEQAVQHALENLPGWSLGCLLPIPIVLRDFAAFVRTRSDSRGSVRVLLAFLQASLAAQGCDNALQLLQQHLTNGTAVLLLDGLDEVVGSPVLERVVESIAHAATTYASTPILVTCRVLDYQASHLRQLKGFAAHMLAPFTDEQIRQFVTCWYQELATSGRITTTQATEKAAALQHAIAQREELQTMAGLPLLITVMALVHHNKGKLPDARALLYYECIDLLLLRWRQQPGKDDLLTRLGIDQFRSSDLLTLMAQLGFTAHEQAGSQESEDNIADLAERDVVGILADGFAPYDYERRYTLAQLVQDALVQGNGLLLKRGPQVYAFPHRTFQEFLAGYHLMGKPNFTRAWVERALYPHWREPLLLVVGYQVLASREFDRPLMLVNELLQRSPSEQVLAADILLTIGRERLTNYDADQVNKRDGIWRRAHKILLNLSAQGKAPDVPATLRVQAGLLIGKLATYDTPHAQSPILDPRLPLAVIGLPVQAHISWHKALDHYWCPIAAGDFWYGAYKGDYGSNKDKRIPLKRAKLDYDFKIARYPITNADFARFIASDGYNLEQPWWTTQGKTFMQSENRTQPVYWNDNRYNNPVQPVVGISWYEAVAYCRWLTLQGHEQGWLPHNETIRLPTSLEWERAARHTDKRAYPWGDTKPDDEFANYAHHIGFPSPIGCYPNGVAACGAHDMAGNVVEWMATPDGDLGQKEPLVDRKQHNGVALSGSGFWNEKEYLFCGSRVLYGPYSRNTYWGFRCICSITFVQLKR